MDLYTTLFLLGAPIIVAVISQTMKFVIKSFQGPSDEPNWRYLDDYGGMPSGHTSFLVALDTAIILVFGWQSIPFVIAAIFTIVIVRDALGLRTLIGEHAKTLNKLIKKIPEPERKDLPKHLEETIGHNFLEVAVGGIIGVGVTLLLYYLILL